MYPSGRFPTNLFLVEGVVIHHEFSLNFDHRRIPNTTSSCNLHHNRPLSATLLHMIHVHCCNIHLHLKRVQLSMLIKLTILSDRNTILSGKIGHHILPPTGRSEWVRYGPSCTTGDAKRPIWHYFIESSTHLTTKKWGNKRRPMQDPVRGCWGPLQFQAWWTPVCHDWLRVRFGRPVCATLLSFFHRNRIGKTCQTRLFMTCQYSSATTIFRISEYSCHHFTVQTRPYFCC